ncbi:bifunctional acetaldehyde-CoA/alcohol dehydrogenase [Halothermothrix orenii]|uniref:Aldehyde-alcohol dehydrogenase n=1 Tax=Halothermothrix orenii (strain H 168 / OCM 544 / DSM 9562) TaxID=373903 RepID=B8D103_HALOH|nr:bifunctional acetaldehyde-CoA/alcohol dehydrogenase [Halothermothrix orenii]ACL68972.1 iron-containing alcohol dehydrogenase [Halothermothrix orenii H 168]
MAKAVLEKSVDKATKEKKEIRKGLKIEDSINKLVERANEAARKFKDYDQEQVDRIVKKMALAANDKHIELAKMAHRETGMGVYEDKITKNLFASEYVYNYLRDKKTAGILNKNIEENYIEVAEPIGVVAALTPVTNPTSTTIFKALICMKTRNPVIFSFHPRAMKCSIEAARILKEAAIKAGAPENCISWIEEPSIEATNYLMKHPEVDLILATGGSGMVKAAYSSGKPALGVGPGNVPCYIEKTANIKQAVSDLILSKTFDNGMICASEQAVVVDKEIAAEVKKFMQENGCYFVSKKESEKLARVAVDQERGAMNPAVVGQPARKIAKMAGIKVPDDTKILVAELKGVGENYPLSREKLSPILGWYVVKDYREGIKRCEEITEFGGLGHSSVLHSNDEKVIDEFSRRLRTGRLIINSPSSQGAIGDMYNFNVPSLTLGCGSMGKNSTTDNVNVDNLINKKRVAMRKERMKWVKVPPRIYFEYGSLRYLSGVRGERAFIITDKTMSQLGFIDKVEEHLSVAGVQTRVFDSVEPDPSVETVLNGCQEMNEFKPDIIIALGGGSPMDAAKGMWLFYEHPETRFEDLKMKFNDIRKRVYKFPRLGKKATFIAVPTTSGTGSEVTAFSVITDKKRNIKYPLADYELTPDIAIIDPELVLTVPQSVTADTGLDVLTHAIEAYVSVMASDYTDALAEKAIKLVFEYLPRAYKNGNDREARKKMHNASCIAGMAFTNAFLGLNHSMAHILGGKFHIPHGRANAILLPHVIRYNAGKPSKLASFPQYDYPRAGERYAEIARILGLPASTTEEGVESLVKAITDLMRELNIPLSLEEAGVNHNKFEKELEDMADIAHNDQCTGTNPRMPLVNEIKEIYRQAYKGVSIKDKKKVRNA